MSFPYGGGNAFERIKLQGPNGQCMLTHSIRYPMLVDPPGQILLPGSWKALWGCMGIGSCHPSQQIRGRTHPPDASGFVADPTGLAGRPRAVAQSAACACMAAKFAAMACRSNSFFMIPINEGDSRRFFNPLSNAVWKFTQIPVLTFSSADYV